MLIGDFTEAVYQFLLHDIAPEGWQTNREVASLPLPLPPTRARPNITFLNGTMFPPKGLR